MTTEKKTVMANEELKERLKEACEKNGWTGTDVIDFYFDDSHMDLISGSREDIIRGFIYAMFCSGIITFKERDSFVKCMFDNRF